MTKREFTHHLAILVNNAKNLGYINDERDETYKEARDELNESFDKLIVFYDDITKELKE